MTGKSYMYCTNTEKFGKYFVAAKRFEQTFHPVTVGFM